VGTSFKPTKSIPASQLLSEITKDSSADKAGLLENDYLLEINNINVESASHEQCAELIRATGETLLLKVITVTTDMVSKYAACVLEMKSKYVLLNKNESVIGNKSATLSKKLLLHSYLEGGNTKTKHGFFMRPLGKIQSQDKYVLNLLDEAQIELESSERLLEYISIFTDDEETMITNDQKRLQMITNDRQNDLVYEDNFNPIIFGMVQEFSYSKLYDVCAKYESEEDLSKHDNLSMKNSSFFTEKGLNKDEARAAAFAIAFYTGSQSDGINRGASMVARTSNGAAIKNLSEDDLNDAVIILYYLIRGLAHIPYYWGVSSRAVDLTNDELKVYTSESLITWFQFSSSKKGRSPPDNFSKERNTKFIIHSITGRPIQQFSMFPDEDEVLLLPHSVFIVLDHQVSYDNIHHTILMRQVELGFCKMSVLWVDDHIFDENWENKRHMEQASTRSLNVNVHFIAKSTTDSALSFLRSTFGQRLKNRETFRIVTDMNRDNEYPYQNTAGVRLIKKLRKLNFENQCLIFTGDEKRGREKVEKELSTNERKFVSITTNPDILQKFVCFEEKPC
ncbi:unnamed protein product, partial [Didymodactylos carnosus]